MKIMTVGYLHGAGGAERQIVLLSNQMGQRGHDVTLCVLCENKSNYSIDTSINVIDLSSFEGSGHLRIFRRFFAFRKAVKDLRPDIIVNYNIQSAYFCLAISKRFRGKIVYSERGDPYDSEYSGLLGMIRDYTVRHIDGIVFQSEGARDFFPKNVKQKSVVIHNSVCVPQLEYPLFSEREKRVVSVGRLHLQKNQRLLILAFSLIAKIFPDYTLDIYGDGPLYDELQQLIESLSLTERVHLLESRKDIFSCIYKASLFVLTSNYEGMPNALMEAMALGLPCISTDCRPGGARTLIENGMNGYIVPRDDVQALASQMEFLLKDRVIASSIADNARQISKTHSGRCIFDMWDKYLRQL